eukprot:TRINITY_DN7736_c0_g1_i3.p1 TRINITY_DN7736_c0_g1~~TRINITY_DN7736_c0_g1_i3.p1  ORF type:complete len:430 (-),score=87.68 TRINITY_DN7736_c0_g1_i3:40-1272(-)
MAPTKSEEEKKAEKQPFPRYGKYQSEIFFKGLKGEKPALSSDPLKLEISAKKVMTANAWGYSFGSSGIGLTTKANREAFNQYRIIPQMLRSCTVRDLRCTLFGRTYPAPVLLAPIGVCGLYHNDAEEAPAKVAGELGIPFILSTAATKSIEDVALANGSDNPRWFQLYWPHDQDITLSLLRRAEASGYEVLVVTLDTWQLSWRSHDIDNAFYPIYMGLGNGIGFTDPVFMKKYECDPKKDMKDASVKWADCMWHGVSHTWAELPFLRKHWKGPIVLKGIQSVDDARLAISHGCEGIIVSNHGGRQVDGAVASLDQLRDIVDAVGSQCTILFDSGIRTGADIFKAIALGAKAVLVGRPYIYGLAHSGDHGVRHVVKGLIADFDLTMGLSGHASLSELNRSSMKFSEFFSRL